MCVCFIVCDDLILLTLQLPTLLKYLKHVEKILRTVFNLIQLALTVKPIQRPLQTLCALCHEPTFLWILVKSSQFYLKQVSHGNFYIPHLNWGVTTDRYGRQPGQLKKGNINIVLIIHISILCEYFGSDFRFCQSFVITSSDCLFIFIRCSFLSPPHTWILTIFHSYWPKKGSNIH